MFRPWSHISSWYWLLDLNSVLWNLSLDNYLSLFLKKYLFICLHWVFVVAGGLLSCGMWTLSCSMHVGSSSLTRGQTWAPCTGSAESYPLRRQGSPLDSSLYHSPGLVTTAINTSCCTPNLASRLLLSRPASAQRTCPFSALFSCWALFKALCCPQADTQLWPSLTWLLALHDVGLDCSSSSTKVTSPLWSIPGEVNI